MAFAVELYLDEVTEGIIRGIWKTIAEAGISTSMMAEGFYPHITLGIANQLDSTGLWPALSNLARETCPINLTLSHIGVFPNAEGVVYLGATATRPLLEFHEAFHQIFNEYAQEPWAYYQVGNWVPHCTVSFGLTGSGVTQVVSLCLQVGLPLKVALAGIGVAEVLPNRARTIFMHRLDSENGLTACD
jgi:hypothetical protein